MTGWIWGFPEIRGTIFEGPYNKDYNILGSKLGSPLFWETTIYSPPRVLGFRVYGPLKWVEYGVCGDLILLYPKLYSIYFRGTMLGVGLGVLGCRI